MKPYKYHDKVVLLGTKEGKTSGSSYNKYFTGLHRHKGDVCKITTMVGDHAFFLDNNCGRFFPCDVKPYRTWRDRIK